MQATAIEAGGRVEFFKYHGTGNDFVILDGMERGPFLAPEEIEALCRRTTGIGADGVIFACSPPPGADASMRIFNADGSEAEMCGNGIRCLAKYLYERAGIRRESMLVETAAGARSLRLAVENGLVAEVEVDMGLPDFNARDLPPPTDRARPGEVAILLEDGEEIAALCLSMGNPHCVLFVSDLESAPVARLGPLLETHHLFPNRTNVEFAQVVDAGHIRLRVWERGVGETQACGTGACAAFVAAMHTARAGKRVDVEVPGGRLRIRVDDSGHVYLSGPAVEVYKGELSPGWRG